MSIEISSIGISPVAPVENFPPSLTKSAPVKTPPPPPPPPPVEDTVQLSLSASIQKLQSEGDSPTEIAQALGVPVQTISIELGTNLIESAIASAPTLPASPVAG